MDNHFQQIVQWCLSAAARPHNVPSWSLTLGPACYNLCQALHVGRGAGTYFQNAALLLRCWPAAICQGRRPPCSPVPTHEKPPHLPGMALVLAGPQGLCLRMLYCCAGAGLQQPARADCPNRAKWPSADHHLLCQTRPHRCWRPGRRAGRGSHPSPRRPLQVCMLLMVTRALFRL